MTAIRKVLEDLQGLETRRALWAYITDFYHIRGVKMISYHAVNAGGQSDGIATDGFPQAWVDLYRSENLERIDPIPQLAANMARPFYWHEVETLCPLTEDNLRYIRIMREAHLGDGLAFDVFGPNNRNAYVGLGFGVERVELPVEEVFVLQCVAQAGHLRYCEIHNPKPDVPALTPRETEVLDWMAQGKSNSVIGDILGMSRHTVDTHVRSIYEKLDVRDRTTAAIKGLGHGLIHLT